MKRADLSKFDPNGAGELDSNIFGLSFNADESNVVLIPVPWEATTSYGRGAVHGPECIRSASPQLDLFDPDFAMSGMPRPWEFGIHLLPAPKGVSTWNKKASALSLPVIKAGGNVKGRPALQKKLDEVNTLSKRVHDAVRHDVLKWLQREKIVGVVGGEHSVSYGAIAACAEHAPGIGVLHLDAHADLRKAYEGFEHSHASVMRNVVESISGVARLVQVGIRDLCDEEYALTQEEPRIKTWFDCMLRERLFRGASWADLCQKIIEDLPAKVYVSFDIDALDPALCPHTGTPVPGGLSYAEAVFLLKELSLSGREIVGFDLTEVAPAKVRSDEWDGNVGARILYRLCAAALRTRL